MTRPLGVFDSGIGGLSVLRHIRAALPQERLIYYADQAHVPYGGRSADEVRAFCRDITQFLLDQGAKLIVVACNTASAAALTYLREQFPQTPFVGMEPAVKPGAQATRSGKVGVLATSGTFLSQRYAALMKRYAQDVVLWEDACLGLVEFIETLEFVAAESPTATQTYALLQRILTPMLQAGVDTLVLGCTHYPFVTPLIQAIAGPEVAIIDPAPAVARQTTRLLHHHDLAEAGDGAITAYTSGEATRLAYQAQQLLGYTLPVWPVFSGKPI